MVVSLCFMYYKLDITLDALHAFSSLHINPSKLDILKTHFMVKI